VTTTALHTDCVVCREREDPEPHSAVLTVLLMCTHLGCTPESIVRDLCFEHRRILHAAQRSVEEERKR
jgi:Rieske Fe-S protein